MKLSFLLLLAMLIYLSACSKENSSDSSGTLTTADVSSVETHKGKAHCSTLSECMPENLAVMDECNINPRTPVQNYEQAEKIYNDQLAFCRDIQNQILKEESNK